MIGKRLIVLGLGVALVLLVVGSGVQAAHSTVRWDIISLRPPDVFPGGIASARANDGSKITLVGAGTFRIKPGNPQVTGGGRWVTFSPAAVETGRGSFQVTGVVRFELAPGTSPPFNDKYRNPSGRRPGLASLSIQFSDGSEGVLTVSCHLVGTPDSVFEGITVSKGFVDYWNREAPVDGVDANRTLFHVTS